MNVSEFSARILVLFAPGVVMVLIVDALTQHSERKPLHFLIHSFVFGALAYGTYAVLWWLNSWVTLLGGIEVSWWPEEITIFQALVDSQQEIDLAEVSMTACISVPLAFAVAYAINHKYLHRMATHFDVTRKTADQDIWTFTFELPDVDWVVVRDLANDLIYEGWVRAYSVVETPRELLIFDVTVYKNKTGDKLYSVDAMYVSRKNEDWTVEFPNLRLTQEKIDGAETGTPGTTEPPGRRTEGAGGACEKGGAEPATEQAPPQ